MKTLRQVLFSCVLLISLAGLGAQVSEWALRAGGTSSERGKAVVTDGDGNIYVTGWFNGTADFGTISLTSTDGYDIYVAKLDAMGNWLWVAQAGGTAQDYSYDIAVDNAGNVYVTGNFYENAWFGLTYLECGDGLDGDIFVAKLDTNGNWLWAVSGGSESEDKGKGITVDNYGNCYITGELGDIAYFGTIVVGHNGGYDMFVAKLDTNGTWLWARQSGGPSGEGGNDIKSDGEANLYVTGYFNGTAYFGSTSLTSAGNTDIFAGKMDANGNWLWAVRGGGTSVDYANSIAFNESSGIFLTGNFYETADFGTTELVSAGYNDIFVARLDTLGGFWLWAKRAGGNSYDASNGIAADDNGCIYVTGNFTNYTWFNDTYLFSNGNSDIFAAKLTSNGTWLWARRMGGSIIDEGHAITVNGNGGCICTGFFMDTADFGTETLTSTGGYEIFVTRINEPTPVVPQNITISNLGYDVIVNWDGVSLDTWGYPISPDYYFVYYNTDGITEPFQYLTLIPAVSTQYVHQHAGFFSANHFYQVTAVLFFAQGRIGLDNWLRENLREGMTKAEVEAVLREINLR